MTAEPKAPGAPAIFLYRQVDRDDASYYENVSCIQSVDATKAPSLSAGV
jgi:hypothetical protein